MKSERSAHQQVRGLFKLAEVRFLRQAGLLNEQKDVVAKYQNLHDQCGARLVELRQNLSELRQQRQQQCRVTAHDLQIQIQDDQARQEEIDKDKEKLSELARERGSAIAEMHAIQQRLHAMKLRNDALKDKLGSRLAQASRRLEVRRAELDEDDFSQRGYRQ